MLSLRGCIRDAHQYAEVPCYGHMAADLPLEDLPGTINLGQSCQPEVTAARRLLAKHDQ